MLSHLKICFKLSFWIPKILTSVRLKDWWTLSTFLQSNLHIFSQNTWGYWRSTLPALSPAICSSPSSQTSWIHWHWWGRWRTSRRPASWTIPHVRNTMAPKKEAIKATPLTKGIRFLLMQFISAHDYYENEVFGNYMIWKLVGKIYRIFISKLWRVKSYIFLTKIMGFKTKSVNYVCQQEGCRTLPIIVNEFSWNWVEFCS